MAFSLRETCWVDADGSYGAGEIITFDATDLTEKQWDVLVELTDSERLDYVSAIMSGEPLAPWEEQ